MHIVMHRVRYHAEWCHAHGHIRCIHLCMHRHVWCVHLCMHHILHVSLSLLLLHALRSVPAHVCLCWHAVVELWKRHRSHRHVSVHVHGYVVLHVYVSWHVLRKLQWHAVGGWEGNSW